MSRFRQRWVSLSVQVAVVCTGLVLGLIPLTAPLPTLRHPWVAAGAGSVLVVCVAGIGVSTLAPRWFTLRSAYRAAVAAGIGCVAAVTGFVATPGLATRPLLIVTAGALLTAVVGLRTPRSTGGPRRKR